MLWEVGAWEGGGRLTRGSSLMVWQLEVEAAVSGKPLPTVQEAGDEDGKKEEGEGEEGAAAGGEDDKAAGQDEKGQGSKRTAPPADAKETTGGPTNL